MKIYFFIKMYKLIIPILPFYKRTLKTPDLRFFNCKQDDHRQKFTRCFMCKLFRSKFRRTPNPTYKTKTQDFHSFL